RERQAHAEVQAVGTGAERVVGRDEIIRGLLSHWLGAEHGWRPCTSRPEFSSADLVVENEDRVVWVIAIAEGSGGDAAEVELGRALGRLLLAMPREYPVNGFGLAMEDPACDPPLARYALAFAKSSGCRGLLRRIPRWVRLRLQLTFALVSSSAVSVYLP